MGMSSMTREWGGGGAASVENVKKWLSLSLSQSSISVFQYVYKGMCVCMSVCVNKQTWLEEVVQPGTS